MIVVSPLSLRARLAVIVAAGSTVVVAVAALALSHDLTREVSRAITTELQVRVTDLAADVDGSGGAVAQYPVLAQVIDVGTGSVIAPPGAPPLLTPDELAAASDGRLLVDRNVPALGGDGRLLARSFGATSSGALVGVAATSTASLRHVRDRLLTLVLVVGPFLVAAMTAAAWLLAGAALRPVRQMALRAASISMSSPGERLPQPPGDDEIAELGVTLNQMLARIETTVAHERAFIDDASHELRAPLAVLRGELELAAAAPDDVDAVVAGLHSALEETDRLVVLSEALLTLARIDAGQLQPDAECCDLTAVARRVVRQLPHPASIGVRVDGDGAVVRGDPASLVQVVTNLVANAVRYASSEVVVFVGACGDVARLVVADDGPGFPPDLLTEAFDRFTRGDDSRGRGGAGLGLAIVASLVGALGGRVVAANGAPLGGACVVVTLPGAQR